MFGVSFKSNQKPQVDPGFQTNQQKTEEYENPLFVYKVEGKEFVYNKVSGSYTGDWKWSKPHGKGKIEFGKSSYDGDWYYGTPHGQGTMDFTVGPYLHYKGQLEDGKPQGIGTMIYADDSKYEGMFKGGLRDGEGTMLFLNGLRVKGNWKNDRLVGDRTYIYSDGTKFFGNLGYGEYTLPDGAGTKYGPLVEPNETGLVEFNEQGHPIANTGSEGGRIAEAAVRTTGVAVGDVVHAVGNLFFALLLSDM